MREVRGCRRTIAARKRFEVRTDDRGRAIVRRERRWRLHGWNRRRSRARRRQRRRLRTRIVSRWRDHCNACGQRRLGRTIGGRRSKPGCRSSRGCRRWKGRWYGRTRRRRSWGWPRCSRNRRRRRRRRRQNGDCRRPCARSDLRAAEKVRERAAQQQTRQDHDEHERKERQSAAAGVVVESAPPLRLSQLSTPLKKGVTSASGVAPTHRKARLGASQ